MSIRFFFWILLVGMALPVKGQQAVSLLSGQVNTANDDTAPFQYGGRIYFTSIYQQHLDAGAVHRIFSTNGQGATQFNINPKNAESHAADLTLSSDAKRMFYTVCKNDVCQIWYRERNYEGDWAAAKRLPAQINLRGASNREPTVGHDRNLGKDVLYFSSDRKGGKGGYDIWASVIEPNYETGKIKFTKPFSLDLNTSKNEVTPFFHMASQTLFFSSDGLLGFGGHDVFSTHKGLNGKWEAPQNAGAILNGPADDMHYSFHTSSRKGYFSSNRGAGGDFDIYEVRPQVEMQISAYDINEGEQLSDVVAEVFDEELGRSFVYREQPFDSYLRIPLMPERKYRIALLAEGYSPQLIVMETENQQIPTVIEQEVRLFREGLFFDGNREVPGEVFSNEEEGAVRPVPVRSGLNKLQD